MIHKLKIWPQFYCRVEDGSKTFEVRNNDRGYQPGDTVELHEYDPTIVEKEDYTPMGGETYHEEKGYTNSRPLIFDVGYVLPIEGNKVVFSLLPIAGKPGATESARS